VAAGLGFVALIAVLGLIAGASWSLRSYRGQTEPTGRLTTTVGGSGGFPLTLEAPKTAQDYVTVLGGPVTIESVRLQRPSPVTVTFSLATSSCPSEIGLPPQPECELRPVAGARLEPGQHMLIASYALTHPSAKLVTVGDSVVVYRTGSQRRTAVMPTQICVLPTGDALPAWVTPPPRASDCPL
jgi:hypothetical protein